MLVDIKISDETFLQYAMRYYDKPCCLTIEEFEKDINRIVSIKKLINRYVDGSPLMVRLILNHIIVLNNIFGPKATPILILFKNKNYWHILVPFLIFLNIMTETIPEIGFNLSDINLDQHSINLLREI